MNDLVFGFALAELSLLISFSIPRLAVQLARLLFLRPSFLFLVSLRALNGLNGLHVCAQLAQSAGSRLASCLYF